MNLQPPSGDRLARRIIDRYGQSPGLISTEVILRQADHLNRFGIGRLPLLASMQRRYALARTYLIGGRSEFRYAWPFAAARALASGSAIMPTADRGENGQSGLTKPMPASHAPAAQSESQQVSTIPPGPKRQRANPIDRPIRRVVRQAGSKAPMPVVQTAGRSAFTPSQTGSIGPNPLSPNGERVRVRGRQNSLQSNSLEQFIELSPPHPRPLPQGGEGVKTPYLCQSAPASGRGGVIFPGNHLNHPIPAISRIRQVSDRPNLGVAIVQRHSHAPLGAAVQRRTASSLPISQQASSAAADQRSVGPVWRNAHSPVRPGGQSAGSPSVMTRAGVGAVVTDTIDSVGELTPPFSKGGLGGILGFKGRNRTFPEFAHRITIQRAAQSDTSSQQHMPLAMPPKPIMMSTGDTPQVQTRSTGGERLSSPGGLTFEETPLQPPAAGSVPHRDGEPEYTNELVDRVLRKLKRQLAVESERRGWRRWP